MKRITLILICAMFSFVLLGCSNSIAFTHYNVALSVQTEFDSINSNMVILKSFEQKYEYVSQNGLNIIDNTSFRLKASEYNSEYFQEKDLIIVLDYIDKNRVKSIYTNDKTLVIKYKKYTGNAATNYQPYACFIEIEKQAENITVVEMELV